MTRSLSMRELQKLSSSAIRALPHAVPITSGTETVALLLPIRPPPPEQVRAALDEIEAIQAQWTPEEREEMDKLLRERGVEI